MEIDAVDVILSLNITCSKCKKTRATTEANAHALFNFCKHTNAWYKQCVDCRKKYNEYVQKTKIRKCEHGHHTSSCAICAKRCEHKKYPGRCIICNPNAVKRLLCEHGKSKYICKACHLCIHNDHRKKCKQCVIDEFLEMQN
jgi:hypothetical protein